MVVHCSDESGLGYMSTTLGLRELRESPIGGKIEISLSEYYAN